MIYKLTIQEKGGAFHGLKYMQTKIITEINRLKNLHFTNDVSFNNIYMSNVLFNIISDSSHFHVNDEFVGDNDKPIGILSGMPVYIDLSINRNYIKLSLTKDQIRDSKINTILDKNGIEKPFEAIIEVDSDLI